MFADLTSIAGSLYKFTTGRGLPGETVPRRISVYADECNKPIGKESTRSSTRQAERGFR
jgi:hypothetical protein